MTTLWIGALQPVSSTIQHDFFQNESQPSENALEQERPLSLRWKIVESIARSKNPQEGFSDETKEEINQIHYVRIREPLKKFEATLVDRLRVIETQSPILATHNLFIPPETIPGSTEISEFLISILEKIELIQRNQFTEEISLYVQDESFPSPPCPTPPPPFASLTYLYPDFPRVL